MITTFGAGVAVVAVVVVTVVVEVVVGIVVEAVDVVATVLCRVVDGMWRANLTETDLRFAKYVVVVVVPVVEDVRRCVSAAKRSCSFIASAAVLHQSL